MMKPEELFAKMSPEERLMQLGRATDNPLMEAFDAKRVVHAGLNGRPLSLKKRNKHGKRSWQRSRLKDNCNRRIFTFRFARRSACTADFSKRGQSVC